jgi:hypothetical protein
MRSQVAPAHTSCLAVSSKSVRPFRRKRVPAMRIDVDDPARPDVQALLEEHLRDMYSLSPPESVHVGSQILGTPPRLFFSE